MKKSIHFGRWTGYMLSVRKFILIMKLTTFLFLVSVLQVMALDGNSQATRISLNYESTSLKNILATIENETNYYFLYSSAIVDTNQKLSINVDNKDITDVLKELLNDTGIEYEIKGRQILLKGNDELVGKVAQQTLGVAGKVTDASGTALPGVAVIVKGTNQGMVTGVDGAYSLSNVPADGILVFSFVGMKSLEIFVDGKSSIDVILQEESIGLEEVVAVGYGTQKKVNLTGSVTSVNSETLENRPITQASQALSGLAAGVTVSQNSSRPDADGASIRIRGLGTFSGAGSSPLVIVDGMEAALNDVDPNNIKSISVLKDAASASIYGSKAANGVILVETKRGQKGKTQINYDSYFGWQKVTELPDFVESWEYATLRNEANKNMGSGAAYTDAEIELFRNGSDPDNYPNVNHLKDLLTSNSGYQTKHNLTVTGGNANSQYLFSLGYLHQDGVVAENDYDRYNFQLNIDNQVLENVKFKASIGGYTSDRNEPRHGDGNMENMIWFAVREGAQYAGRKSDGTYGYQDNYSPEAWIDSESLMNYRKNQFMGSAELEWEILPGLSVSGQGSYKHYNRSEKNYLSTVIFDEYKTYGPNRLWLDNEFTNLLQLQTLVRYNKTFGDHSIALLGGASQEEYKQEWNLAYRQNFPNNSLYQLDAGSQDGMSNSGSGQEYGLRSFFGRLNYSFKDRYLVEVNTRYDGTSRFPKASRWGLFPSVSLGWRVSEESFMKDNVEWIDNLKLRTSWGQLGNQNIGYYPYQGVLNSQTYSFGGSVASGLAVTNYVNKDITWETTTITDIGFDMTILGGLLDVTADYFNKKTSDILYSVASSKTLGLSTSESNNADVSNKGFEIALSYRPSIGDLKLRISPNFSYVKNEVTKLGGGVTADYSAGLFVGEPINAIYGYVADGLFVDEDDISSYASQPYSAQPGFIRYKDISGPDGVPDGKVDATYDRKVLGASFPKFSYGMTFTADYKGFDLMVLMQGLGGQKQQLGSYQGYALYNGGQIQRWQADNRWTEENPDRDAEYPKLTSLNNSSGVIMTSSYWLRDASFLRIKNIQLGYTLPDQMISGLGISKLRVYFSGQNMFTFSKSYPGWDPEIKAGNFYPITATYTFGLNLKF